MTDRAKENIDKMKELGINTMKFDYDSCVEILINKYVEAYTSLEYDEEQRFRNNLDRIKKPSN
jgi:hypothetical protein